MARFNSVLELKRTWPVIFILALTLTHGTTAAADITASIGRPYRGSLVNGIPFPTQFEGYTLRSTERTHTTPEVVGALLDAIDGVRQEFPETCDLYLGDFSNPQGGPMTRHRSHQNGRDVDIGYYARGNRPLQSFIPMSGRNLDVPKTWSLLENLLLSQRVQYMFIDRSLHGPLKDYALSKGVDERYLDGLFAGNGIIRHIRGHADHVHVRFFAPWSTMAANLKESDHQKRKVVAMAQQAYLPKRVHYYVKGNEKNLLALARSFGVTQRDLCRWNNVKPSDIIPPGTSLTFYKRGFEIEPVHLAQSLRPDSIAEVSPARFAALNPSRTISDLPGPANVRNRRQQQPTVETHTVRRGETLSGIAKTYKTTVKALQDLNGMNAKSNLRIGQKIKVARGAQASQPTVASASSRSPQAAPTVRKHKVAGGESLSVIAQKYGISTAELSRINKLDKNSILRVGQELIVSQGSRSDAAPTVRKHKVAGGESLSVIAQKYGISTAELSRINKLDKSSILRVGQELIVSQKK